MKKKNTTKPEFQDSWNLSFTPILRYNIIFSILIVVIILIGGGILTLRQMNERTQTSLNNVQRQIEYRIDQSIKLLESLASRPEFYDPSVSPHDKALALDKIGPQFDYFMTCFVDSDINVHSSDSEPASLASRDYLQTLFATGQTQITDSFAAGADGVTLNYTIAVPLFDENKKITGAIFSSLYFDEMQDLLKFASDNDYLDAVLIGSKGQLMSSTRGLPYGDEFMNDVKSSFLLGESSSSIEENLLNKVPGSYWSIKQGSLHYTSYKRITDTQWDLVCETDFFGTYKGNVVSISIIIVLSLILCFIIQRLMSRYVKSQMVVLDALVHSVQELEKKIYQDENPDNHDFREVLRLTSTGLSDSLTGVVTRFVFLNQLEQQLKGLKNTQVSALCFIDLDDLKGINDTYGHAAGDIALKSIGYVLREYEKKYNGLVGRYGGDEFILFLSDLDDEKELIEILDELVIRLKTSIIVGNNEVPIRCSVGVSLIQSDSHIDKVISEADEALYFVKQNGKGYYKIYRK